MSPKAFFLNPPGLPATTANREGSAGMGVTVDEPDGFVYPPHLLASAAASLRAAGWSVAGLDAVALGLDADSTLERLPQTDLLFLATSCDTLAADRTFLNRLREHKPLLKVVAIGPALSYSQVAHALNDLADLLVAGEPELALPPLARYLLRGHSPPHLEETLRPGSVVNPYVMAQDAYGPDGTLVDLDSLPLPAWDVFQTAGLHYPFLTIMSSRGCPAGCLYCPYVAAQGSDHRTQSPGRTAQEMGFLARQYSPPHVVFRDPVFAHDRNRVLALCSELRQRSVSLSWECESRPEHFDARILRAMQAAGCTTVKLGLESADPELLVAVRRVADQEAARRYLQSVTDVVAQCRQLGILCRVFVMVGLPGQTMDSVRQTADYLRELQPARLHVKPFHWYPGIGLPQASEPDVTQQLALLSALSDERPARWRRLVRRLVG
jgi:radical SAM superfamily enzyme YgiQ (UPF0313 family)